VKKLFEVTLGVLTAIGGLIDIGNLVANPQAGARFGMGLAWVLLLGLGGIMLYMEMASRVAVLSGRPVFDVIRERLGARMALINLIASFGIIVLTMVAEIGGVSLLLELVTGLNYVLWIPVVALVVWIVVWKLPYQWMEHFYGLLGLGMLVVVVAVWQLHPDWGAMLHGATHPTIPPGESGRTYAYLAVAQFGSMLEVYQVFFFSSGVIEEGWKPEDLWVARANIFLGFPLGVLIALALMAGGALVLGPASIQPDQLAQAILPTVLAVGRLGLGVLFLGMFAAIFGAALETTLSSGYTLSQYFGWEWGKLLKPLQAPRFNLVMLSALLGATVVALTTLDPVKVTEFVLILTAAAVPLTFFPILVVANDSDYVGEKTNSRLTNAIASGYLVIMAVTSIVAIPLMIWTRGGA
jgi:Mn2+/Fe2+ NRAMP family transporter